MLPCALRVSETFYGNGESYLFSFYEGFKVGKLVIISAVLPINYIMSFCAAFESLLLAVS